MKLHSHSRERIGSDNYRISALWTDKMRRPCQVKITWSPLQNISSSEQPVIEGDGKETKDILWAIAEIAWENGWRPRGFPGALAAFAQHYKLPSVEA